LNGCDVPNILTIFGEGRADALKPIEVKFGGYGPLCYLVL